jgi:tetratricopeptide (TPR) repeat protein
VERLEQSPATEPLARILLAGLEKSDDEEAPAGDGWRSALRRLIEQDASDRPAMLVVDDAHEADEALELARELATPSDRVRRAVLVALIAREDDGLAERPEVENRIAAVLAVSRAKIVHLEPLETGARHELFAHLGLSEALAARVDERSKGNPQFAIQLVEDWVTRGLLAPGRGGSVDDGWVLAGAEPPMPDDLHDVWAARVLQILQSLPGIAGIHLERAAAIGMEVEIDEWHVACDDPAHGRISDAGVRLRKQLVARLVEARLLVEIPRGFRFAHPMLRESVERISRTAGRWGPHHQAVATFLESLDRPDPLRVGVHWLEAGEPMRAIDPLFAGIERGMRRSGIAQVSAALLPLERALREAKIPEDDLRWARLFVRQATVLRRRGMLIAAGDLAEKARALADRPGADTVWSECARELARTLNERGDVPGALLLLQQTAARLLRAGARGTELTMVLARMAVLGRTMHQLDDAERWATQARGILARTETEDPGLEGYVVGELAMIAALRGRDDRMAELFEEATRLLRTGVATARLAEVESNRGEALAWFERWDEAESAFLEATRLQELVGHNPERPRLGLALCRLHQNRFAEARALADEVARGAATKVNGTLAALVRALCDLATRDSAKIGRDLASLLQVLRDARLADPELGWLAEFGARTAPDKAEAVQLATWAREVRETLGDRAALARVEAALAELKD